MKKILLSALLFCSLSAVAQEVKNIILLIPDGCGISTISVARWYQWYMNPDQEFLNIDPYLCGTVRTTCSNAPIGDSAPTTSTYMTGYNSRAGWVSTYPYPNGNNDIYPMDESRAYQPLTTLLEASRIKLGKSVGLVTTCEFPHATPADCSAHSYDRGKYDWIMPQQVHNGLNVVISGGAGILPQESEEYLKAKGYGVFRNDINAMRTYQGDNMWALYAHQSMAYDIDRDPSREPALAEMTRIAIEKLSRNPKGFFLMVEGSEIDYAAHDNDPAAMISDVLSFDKACKEAFDFAKRDGHTLVVVVPDHSNSGLSIGRRDWGGYATTPKDKMFGAMKGWKASADAIERRLNSEPNDKVQQIFKEMAGFELTERELDALNNCKGYRNSPIAKDDRRPMRGVNYQTDDLSRVVGQFMTSRTGLAFTTNGHTGEDVFLAAYHPQQEKRPYGMLTNIQLNEYLCNQFGMSRNTLDSLTAQNFVPHTEILQPGTFEIVTAKLNNKDVSMLVIKQKGGQELWLKAFTNVVQVMKRKGKKTTQIDSYELPAVAIYYEHNKTFYISRTLSN